MKIFIHGLGQSPENWHKTISYMKNTDIVCPDLCDMLGKSSTDYNNLYSGFINYCKNFDEPHDLCGLSIGSVLALNYAVDYPNKVKSLVLIAPQYKMPVKMLKFQNFIFKCMPSSAFGQTGFEKNDFIQLCRTMMHIDFSNCLDKISCPVLILCGEKDKANKKASQKLSNIIENSEFITMKNSGHEVNVDSLEKLSEILKGFYIKER
ncbi:MAG: alpha/beta hydrolase [Ruminococcus flavefaciens]|nr:alpha/beta hydrolase [Ruminococcus flavefaciens]